MCVYDLLTEGEKILCEVDFVLLIRKLKWLVGILYREENGHLKQALRLCVQV